MSKCNNYRKGFIVSRSFSKIVLFFKICLAAPSKTSFYEACLNDLCVSINAAGLVTDAPLPTVCDFIEEKATECLENGYNVYGWPSSDIIHKFCRENRGDIFDSRNKKCLCFLKFLQLKWKRSVLPT